jgi:hypothetical protein
MTERKPPIECRLATVGGVNFAERIITVIAVPYEETASVEYRGELWQERFLRGAFDGIQTIQRRVPVNLFHDARSYVGRVAQFFPDRSEGSSPNCGSIQAPKVTGPSRWPMTMAIRRLSASVCVAVTSNWTRRLRRASSSGLSSTTWRLVPSPAYVGAGVLSVRGADESPDTQLPRLVTPSLDEFVTDPVFQWAAERSRAQTS